MIIKLIFLITVSLNFFNILVDAVAAGEGIIWAPNGGEKRCEMRFENDKNNKACDQWVAPTFAADPDYMRVFQVKTPLQVAYIGVKNIDYRCANLQDYYRYDSGQIAPTNCHDFYCYKTLFAERLIYGSLYLMDRSNQPVRKGKFGPLFVRIPSSENWAEKAPGFDHISDNNADYFFNFFVPYLRRGEGANDDQTLQEWLRAEPGKRDFAAILSLSVVCRSEEKNCEPAAKFNYEDKYFKSYIPIDRTSTNFDMSPKIKRAFLDNTTFGLALDYWVAPGQSRHVLNSYVELINKGGIEEYLDDDKCKHPHVQFILYDSNPAPHEAQTNPPTTTAKWDQMNGEVRAVFARFSVNMATLENPNADLVSSWNITLNDRNWDERQIDFLAAWQKTPAPEGLDPRDIGWYKNWRKANGMSVAFTFCACADPEGFTIAGGLDSIYGCKEYIHQKVDIRDRNNLL